MNYKYSICYPDKENIEYPNKVLTESQVLEMAKNYPWKEQLELLNSLPDEKVCYSPSLDFTNTKTEHSFCLTADNTNGELNFSLWYNRPVKIKPLFGLLGEKTVMKVIDKWSFHPEEAYKHLKTFLDKNYHEIERIMRA